MPDISSGGVTGFKIADAYVEVSGVVDDGVSRESGKAAGEKFDEGFKSETRKRSKDPGPANESGRSFGDRMAKAAGGMFTGTFNAALSALPNSLGSNPYVGAAALGLGATIVTVAGPLVTAGLSGAIIAGAGLGVIGLGAALLKGEPILANAATRLKDVTTKIFTDAAKPMLRPLTTALSSFTALVERSQPLIDRMFAGAAVAITPLSQALIGLVEGALPGFVSMIEASGPLLASLGPSFAGLGKSIGEVFTMFAAMGPTATVALQDIITATGALLVFTGKVIMSFTMAYTAVRGFFTSIPGWLSAAGAWFSALGSQIATWATGVWTWIGTLPGMFAGWFSAIWATISAWGVSVGSFFAALPGRIGAFLAALPGVISGFFNAAAHSALYWFGYMIGTIVGQAMAFPSQIAGSFQAFVSMVGNAFTTAWNWAKTTTTAGAAAVVSFFAALPGRVAGALSALGSRIAGIFNSARSTAASTSSSIVSTVVSTLSALPGRAASAVSAVGSRISSALSGAIGSARSIGSQIIAGLIGGINSMIGSAVSAAKSAVGSIVAGAKSALGISSPSKVAAREVGRWFLPGVVVGVKKTAPKAAADIRSAVGGLVPAMATGGAPASGPMGGGDWGGPGGGSITIGSITLDPAGIKDIQDLLTMINGLQTTSRAYRARTSTLAGV